MCSFVSVVTIGVMIVMPVMTVIDCGEGHVGGKGVGCDRGYPLVAHC